VPECLNRLSIMDEPQKRFLVIHSIPAAEDTLADLGDRLLVALRRPIVTAEGLVTAGGSVCERIRSHRDRCRGTGRAADAGMYRSKRRGRGSPVIIREEV